jgi:hypothetical protein
VRKIINFIYSNYESAELRKLPILSGENSHLSMKDNSPIGMIILNMPFKKKAIFQKLLKSCELSLESKAHVLVEWLYK